MSNLNVSNAVTLFWSKAKNDRNSVAVNIIIWCMRESLRLKKYDYYYFNYFINKFLLLNHQNSDLGSMAELPEYDIFQNILVRILVFCGQLNSELTLNLRLYCQIHPAAF